jgi:hypothetical protein
MKIIFIIFCVIFITACDTKVHKKHFIIENDTERMLGSASFDVNITRLDHLSPTEVANYKREYNDSISTDTPTGKTLYQIAVDNNFIVKNEIYNFYITIPIKTKTDISTLPVASDYPEGRAFYIQRCLAPFNGGGTKVVLIPDLQATKNASEFYHYTLYGDSKSFAGEYLLNSVSDLCLHYIYDYPRSNFSGENYDITSNELVIKAEEVEALLDKLGIVH